MQQKFEFLNQLPKEMGVETATHLATPDLIRLSTTSTRYRTFFNPLLEQRKPLQNFLHHVVRGEHDKVKGFLQKDFHLIVQRDQVTDCSNRTFHFISGFEYTLWALDKHMWTIMLDCIPQNKEGKKVFAQLLSQYNKVKTEGVTYKLKAKTVIEQHFAFKNTLIKALQIQVDSLNAPGAKNWKAINNQWQRGVGGAQRLLPMHIVAEYCSSEPFYPVPKFNSQPKSSNQFFNNDTNKVEDWFSVDSKLGIEFAMDKTYWVAMRLTLEEVEHGVSGGTRNLDAMKALYQARTLDFSNLKLQLEAQADLNIHQQVVPM